MTPDYEALREADWIAGAADVPETRYVRRILNCLDERSFFSKSLQEEPREDCFVDLDWVVWVAEVHERDTDEEGDVGLRGPETPHGGSLKSRPERDNALYGRLPSLFGRQ